MYLITCNIKTSVNHDQYVMTLRVTSIICILLCSTSGDFTDNATAAYWTTSPDTSIEQTRRIPPITVGSQNVTSFAENQGNVQLNDETHSRDFLLTTVTPQHGKPTTIHDTELYVKINTTVGITSYGVPNTNSHSGSVQPQYASTQMVQTLARSPGLGDAAGPDNNQSDFDTLSVTPHTENNAEHNTDFNQSSESTTLYECAWLGNSQLVLSIIGFVANKVTFITLVRNGDMFSPSICILLKHQALVDSWLCAMGTILLLQPPMWTTGNENFDAAVCYLWHGQGLFWGALLLSVWNMALIAVERYIAVCRPFRYAQLQGKQVYYSIGVMYLANVVVTLPAFFQVQFDGSSCLSEFLIVGEIGEKIFYAYCIIWFLAVYLLPITAYIYLYGKVIATLYRRKTSPGIACSKAIDSVQSTVTKTAITLTVIFGFAIGVDAWAYLLGYTGVVEYEFGSLKQNIGVFFSVFNSVVNPVVYLALMPSFRLSLRKTFPPCKRNRIRPVEPSASPETNNRISSTV